MVVLTKLKASTLVENLVAMTIIATVMAIAFTIYSQSFFLILSREKVMADNFLSQELAEIKEQKKFFDGSFTKEKLTIFRKVRGYKNYENLYFVEVTVENEKGKTLTSAKEIITDEEN